MIMSLGQGNIIVKFGDFDLIFKPINLLPLGATSLSKLNPFQKSGLYMQESKQEVKEVVTLFL